MDLYLVSSCTNCSTLYSFCTLLRAYLAALGLLKNFKLLLICDANFLSSLVVEH